MAPRRTCGRGQCLPNAAACEPTPRSSAKTATADMQSCNDTLLGAPRPPASISGEPLEGGTVGVRAGADDPFETVTEGGG